MKLHLHKDDIYMHDSVPLRRIACVKPEVCRSKTLLHINVSAEILSAQFCLDVWEQERLILQEDSNGFVDFRWGLASILLCLSEIASPGIIYFLNNVFFIDFLNWSFLYIWNDTIRYPGHMTCNLICDLIIYSFHFSTFPQSSCIGYSLYKIMKMIIEKLQTKIFSCHFHTHTLGLRVRKM